MGHLNGEPMRRQRGRSGSPPSRLTIKIGGGDERGVEFDGLDADHWNILRDHCLSGDGLVVMTVRDLANWPEEHRRQWLLLAKELGERCRFRMGGRTHKSPFDALLSGITETGDVAVRERQKQMAIEAAAVLHPGAAEETAKKINARLKAVGAATINPASLVKTLKAFAGAEHSGSVAQRLAESYLDAFASSCEVNGDSRVLAYYHHVFHQWTGRRWVAIADAEFAATVMGFLQARHVPGLTAKLRNDVVAHLQGLTLLPDRGVPIPFCILSEQPFEVDKPHRLCAKENLLVDQFALTEMLLLRRGRVCGVQFTLLGPRSVRLIAIWDADCGRVLCYGAGGERFLEAAFMDGGEPAAA